MHKPHFITCRFPSIRYRDKEIENKAVNLALVESISRAKFAWYPDNTGRPSIKYHPCGVEWVYYDQQQRDEEYESITTNKKDEE